MDNICCYDNESKLIQSNEVEGGTLQRYHYLGGKSIQPFFDNFYYDVIPFVYCCRYSKHKSKGMGTSNCHQYLRRRPQSSCLHYVPPRPGEYLIIFKHLAFKKIYICFFNFSKKKNSLLPGVLISEKTKLQHSVKFKFPFNYNRIWIFKVYTTCKYIDYSSINRFNLFFRSKNTFI